MKNLIGSITRIAIAFIFFCSIVSQACKKDKDFFQDVYNEETKRDQKLIGSGGFGKVYYFEKKFMSYQDGISFAMGFVVKTSNKKNNDSFELEAQNYEKIKREVSVWPNHIPNYYGCFVQDGVYHIVLEFAGNSISPCDYDKGPQTFDPDNEMIENYRIFAELDPASRVSIYAQMFEALAELHAKRINHVDIKPENVILRGRRSSPYVYIIDLGGSSFGDKMPRAHTKYYMDEEAAAYYDCEAERSEKLNNGYEDSDLENCVQPLHHWKMDIYSLAVAIFELENSFDKKLCTVERSLLEQLISSKANIRSIVLDIRKEMGRFFWIKTRNLNTGYGENDLFKKVFEKITESKRENRTLSAIEVAKKLHTIAETLQEKQDNEQRIEKACEKREIKSQTKKEPNLLRSIFNFFGSCVTAEKRFIV